MPSSLKKLNEEHVIVIYEGEAERAIYDLLFENKCLVYGEESELIRKSTGTRSAKKFAKENLEKDYEDIPVNIVRILDSDKEKFNLPKQYEDRIKSGEIKVHNIITKPEIEILIILNENGYDEFCKSKYKNDAAGFCKSEYGYKKIKNYSFIYEYFKDVGMLIDCIKKYNTICKKKDYNLFDMLS